MRINRWMMLVATGVLFAANPLSAETLLEREQLQLPHCLARHLSAHYEVLAENKEFTIIDIPSDEVENIVFLADKIHCGRFINVTSQVANTDPVRRKNNAVKQLTKNNKPFSTDIINYPISHQNEVFEAINQVDVNNILSTLTRMTQFENRSATKQTGVDTANWLNDSFQQMVKRYNRSDTAMYFVKTGSHYKQPSLVTVIGKDIKAPAIVIGAHMDTLNGKMPGAGDDGSGSAGIMEMARILLASPIELKHPVYFIWYAAEERGLVGSHYVVRDFIKKSIKIKAAIQFDMTGFRSDVKDKTMWVYRDYVDDRLSDFVEKLIETYLGVPVSRSSCGYGCSDHASWYEKGIPAAFPCETGFDDHNSSIHSSQDTMDKLTPEHMVNFTKLGLAFAIELAGGEG